ncbi:MAG TPA: cation:proton antiporter [Anaerolineales bacterium]|nr:cation:proton antiporter [Anaerolineales bacterium]
MTPFLELLLSLMIILVAAKAAGYLSTLARQPSVLGELLVGLLLGPSLLNLMHWPIFKAEVVQETVTLFSEMGVLLLMFVAGLELHFSDLVNSSKVSALAGVLGVMLPVGAGIGVGLGFGLGTNDAIFLGLTLGATSVSISAQTLMELKKLRSRVGLGLLGAAVFDDILVILLLSVFLAFVEGSGGLLGIAWIIVRMVLFLAGSVAVGVWILPFLMRRVSRLPISQGVLTLGLVVMFAYGLAAELVGSIAAITGAFLAGLMFARSAEKERLERGMSALAYGLFVPIFFVNIGLSLNLRDLNLSVVWLELGVVLVAVFGKFLGAGGGARLAGYEWRESAQLGAGMISRGEVGLILASVGISNGLLSESLFSSIVGMVLITTLITPPLLRILFKPNVKPIEQIARTGEEAS